MKKIFLKIVSIFISCVSFVTLIGCNADNSDSSNHVHKYNRTVADLKYLKEDPTYMTSAVYYKSCACGAKGEETFVYGTPLKVYSEKEKVPYKPTSLTVSLYDAENSIYGFTYNTQSKPLRPVIQIKEGYSLAGAKTECNANVMEATCYNEEGSLQTYYIVKAEIPLEANKLYTYRAYDKYVNVGTDPAPLRTKDVKSTKFTFAHVSDSQTEASDISGKGSGSYFADTLSMLSNNSDFIVHTGDFVEWARYEGYWKAMLDDNFSHLSKIPVMTISGNHETTYQGGTNETFKHFNYKIPTQTTNCGLFYSFVYGNVKFIMLNTNNPTNYKLDSAQYNWLVKELQNNTATWTIVAMHNPMYSVGKYGMNPSKNGQCLTLRAQLQGLFAQYGVDIVLQGHDHVISRTYPINQEGVVQAETWITQDDVDYSVNPNGVIYMMNGPAGDQSRSPFETDDATYKYAQSSYTRSWAEFAVDGNQITVTVKYTNGSTDYEYQKWGIMKSK